MCGHIGFANVNDYTWRKELREYLTTGLFVDQLRGEDGTGIAIGGPNDLLATYKKPMPASDFLQLSSAKKTIMKADHFAIGHNRAATMGAHTIDNTHPFHIGDIILAHNGTLRGPLDYLDGTNSLDSYRIAYHMSHNKLGITPMLENLNGAYALVWYDSADNTINFARNEERPFHVGILKSGKSIIWASERWMMEGIAARSRLQIDEVTTLPIGEWWKIPFELPVGNKWRDTWEVKKFQPKKYVSGSVGSTHTSVSTRDSALEKIGLQKGMLAEISTQDIGEFKHYPSSKTYGFFEGVCSVEYMRNKTNVTEEFFCKVNGVKEDEYDDMFFHDELYAEVSTCWTDATTGLITLGLSGIFAIEEDDTNEEAPKAEVLKLPNKSKDEDTPKLVQGPVPGVLIPANEWVEKNSNGCTNCGTDVLLKDADLMAWTFGEEPVCPGCITEHVYGVSNVKDLNPRSITDELLEMLHMDRNTAIESPF